MRACLPLLFVWVLTLAACVTRPVNAPIAKFVARSTSPPPSRRWTIRLPTPLDNLRRIIVILVNSLSTPDTAWAVARVLIEAPEFLRLLKDIGARVVASPAAAQ